jgi:hypothetical protein
MKKLPGFLIIFIGIFAGSSQLSIYSQEHEEMVKYTTDFRFTDGIYLDFNMVKENNPIPKTKIVTSIDYNSNDFFEKLAADEKLYYYDTAGMKKDVKRSDIWGYADNGILYMQIMDNFNPFTFMGKICHIIAEISYNDTIYFDPVTGRYIYPYSPNRDYIIYGDPYTYIDPYYHRYYDRRSLYIPQNMEDPSSELDQYLIDFETGDIWEYDVEGVKSLIKNDTDLYDEFKKLRFRMKERMMFSFIRRFNERNPLYIPEGKSQ